MQEYKGKAYIGIDPGKNGGIVVIWPDGKSMSLFTIPILNEDIDVSKLVEVFDMIQKMNDQGYEFFCILENVHSIFGVSAKANFVFGKVVGIIQTMIEVYKIPYMMVNPKAWQKVIFQGIAQNENKKVMALQAVTRMFPNTSFLKSDRSRVPHDGLVDSCCLAQYGKISNL